MIAVFVSRKLFEDPRDGGKGEGFERPGRVGGV